MCTAMPLKRYLRLAKGVATPRRDRAHAALFDLHDLLARPRSENEAAIRHLCNAVYLGGDGALCRALGRYKIFVDTADVGLSSHVMLDGYWEMWTTEAIVSLVSSGMVVADVGANIGFFTLLLAELVGPTGKVHAFEPNTRIVDRLRKSVGVNGFDAWTSVHSVALGGTNGEPMVFVVPPSEPKNGFMQPYAGEVPEGGSLIDTVRLDSKPEWHKIEFAKIDAEGAEQLIWAGMQGLLDGGKLRSVILEFTPGRYADPARFIDALCAPGFSLSYIDPARGILPTTHQQLLGGDPLADVMLLLRR
jgi:FkbM family methyltransferase